MSARLQDVLGKVWTLTGVPLVVLAFAALAKGEDQVAEEGKEGKEEGGEDAGKEGEGNGKGKGGVEER